MQLNSINFTKLQKASTSSSTTDSIGANRSVIPVEKIITHFRNLTSHELTGGNNYCARLIFAEIDTPSTVKSS